MFLQLKLVINPAQNVDAWISSLIIRHHLLVPPAFWFFGKPYALTVGIFGRPTYDRDTSNCRSI